MAKLMRQIFRYTEDIQRLLGCKTKPEPWMHIGIKTSSNSLNFSGYVIWVWDTRQVLEIGLKSGDRLNAKCNAAMQIGSKANDNHAPLKSDYKVGDVSINTIMQLGDKPTGANVSSDDAKLNKLHNECKRQLKQLTDGQTTVPVVSIGKVRLNDNKPWSSITGDLHDNNDRSIYYCLSRPNANGAVTDYVRSTTGLMPNVKSWLELFDPDSKRVIANAKIVDILPAKLALSTYGTKPGWSM